LKDRYSLGIDFGTESARFILVRTSDGDIASVTIVKYPHGVIDSFLPGTGIALGPDWVLQDPADYWEVLTKGIPEVIQKAHALPEQVVGIGIDFTSCTMLPVNKYGQPLCWDERYRRNPHSWVKLWKHHAAQREADYISDLAQQRGELFLKRYGGKISSEWVLPKALQILREAPEIYEAADQFVEAADWIIWQLTGNLYRNSCCAGYKAMWSKKEGYPSKEFLASVDPRLENFVDEKLRGEVYPSGTRVGTLSKEIAQQVGLEPGTPVATAIIDAHASVLGLGVTAPGKMVLVMGTSICHMFVSPEERFVPGVAGVVEDGILPGFFGYEAGQAAGGDMLAWFVDNMVPAEIKQEAVARDVSIHEILVERAFRIESGEGGLVALDWWNGSRFLATADLSGLIAGFTLKTKPEHIYLALIESLAFGTKMIIDNVTGNGIPVTELYGCGTLATNDLVAQTFADVTGLPFKRSDNSHASAVGAAVLGAVAAGTSNGGYDSVIEASKKMGRVEGKVFEPRPAFRKRYRELYEMYRVLHRYFGETEQEIMKALKRLRSAQDASSSSV